MTSPQLVPLVTFSNWLGQPLSAADEPRAEAILDAVSALVRSEAGRTWVDDGGNLEEVPTDVQTVVMQVAQRVFLNPLGFQSERSGDYSYAFPTSGPGGLYLEPHERAVLARYRATQRGLWTLSTTRSDTDADTVYVPIQGTESEFPWYAAGDIS